MKLDDGELIDVIGVSHFSPTRVDAHVCRYGLGRDRFPANGSGLRNVLRRTRPTVGGYI